MRYGACEAELKKATEMLARNEVKGEECSELKNQLEMLEAKLKECEARSADLSVSFEFTLAATCLTVSPDFRICWTSTKWICRSVTFTSNA